MQDTKQEKATSYLRALLEGFCDDEPFEIVPRIDELGLTLVINAGKKNSALIIGHEGSVIKSLRKIMQLYGKKNNAKVNVFVPKTNA